MYFVNMLLVVYFIGRVDSVVEMDIVVKEVHFVNVMAVV